MTSESPDAAEQELRIAEEDVQSHSAVFKKELGVVDLVLTQLLFIVGLSWVGVAAKLGPAHVVFWLLAIVLFYLPSAFVVTHLNRLMPLEGGLYQWAKFGFNELVGFLVAWNLWLFAIVLVSGIGLQVTTYLSYALGPRAAWIASNKWFTGFSGCLIIGGLVIVSTVGLGVGKWVHNAGGAMMIALFAALIALPFLNLWSGTLAEYRPFATALPAVTLLNLNILGKMGFGALGGFEYVAILAGECRHPTRAIGRSVLISAPIVALMFILGTSSVLALVPVDEIDLIGPIPQVLSIGTRSLGIAAQIVPVVILMSLAIRVAASSFTFTGNTRLPMVAGWDHLLPGWFTRLHANYRTPVNSIIFVGMMALFMSLVGIIGVGQQEGYQLLQNAAGIFYAIAYLVMFAIPIIGLRSIRPRPPLWLRITSLSGFLMTLLYVTLSVFPIVEVGSQASFTAKISGVIITANVIGAGIFLIAESRRRSANTSVV